MCGQREESCLPKAEHLGVSSVSRGGMGGQKSHVTAVVAVTKERSVLCRVVSCRVTSCVCCKGLMQSLGTAELLCHNSLA